MIYLLSFRDERHKRGGAVLPGRLRLCGPGGRVVAEGREAEAALAVEETVGFLLHGYNVSRDEGTVSLLRFAERLSAEVPGALVATLWPGDHWTGAVSYSFEGRDADETAQQLVRFVRRVLPAQVPLSFASHSLGGRVLLRTLHLLEDRDVRQACLLAPAVDDDCLRRSEVYREGVERVARLGVLHSTADSVLRFAYPAGDLLQSFVFFWREDFGAALGYRGPRPRGEPPNVIDTGVGHHDVAHGDYLPPPDPNSDYGARAESAAVFTAGMLSGRERPLFPDP